MKKSVFIIVLLSVSFAGEELHAQGGRGFMHQEWTVEGGDSIATVHMLPVYTFSRPVDLRRYRRLVRAVKKVYPISKIAQTRMKEMEAELLKLPTKKEQREYVKGVEKSIKEEYTPVLKRMTRFEGKVLVKLIDRQTDYTAFQIVKEFRGGFVAGFWQGIARLFGNNLKLEYDKDGDDKMIEQIVIYYEAGLI